MSSSTAFSALSSAAKLRGGQGLRLAAGSWWGGERAHRELATTPRRAEESESESGPRQELGGGDDLGGASGLGDWRAFRAKLVLAEKEGAEEAGTGEWVHESPIIEQGSILLTVPGNHFLIGQHYFHKVVILILQHDAQFTRGVILNRPTGLSTSSLTSDVPVNDPWNVWCGGDCEGLSDLPDRQPMYFCLHSKPELAAESVEIISGLYQIDLDKATMLTRNNQATKDEFLLLAGYCGWRPGQLQNELDAGTTWAMVSAARSVVIGDLSRKQADLSTRLSQSSGAPLTVEVVGDGIDSWKALYSLLGDEEQKAVEQVEGSEDDEHIDNMLRLWISRTLIPSAAPSSTKPPQEEAASGDAAEPEPKEPFKRAEGGEPKVTVLRASPTSWVLGTPDNLSLAARSEIRERYYSAVFMHKAVLCLVQVQQPEPNGIMGMELLFLLNGPVIQKIPEGEVRFGGPASIGRGPADAKVFAMSVKGREEPILIQGGILLSTQTLKECIESGAIEVVEDGILEEIGQAAPEERWQRAGGTLDSLEDAKIALLGDEQRRKWYKRMLRLDVP